MSKKGRIFVVLVAAALAACASTPEPEPSADGDAGVVAEPQERAEQQDQVWDDWEGESVESDRRYPPQRDPTKAPADVGAPPPHAQVTASGLITMVLQAGHGSVHPNADSTVEVHYTGWSIDGEVFDSSVQRGHPSTFGLRHVIPGWTEGVQLMVEGEVRRLWIPADLAYGEGRPGVPGGMLVFDVELISIH